VVDWKGDPSRSNEDRVKDCWEDPGLKKAKEATTAAAADTGKEAGKTGPGAPDDKPPPKKE
jgi:hypothetical protein